jgi:aspartyl-tRNA(Asn)/glutamyl-tRNA(Gln) amidotransferase subunit A
VIQFPRRLTELQTLIQSGQIDPLDCLQDQANLMYQVNHQYPVIVETLPINESLTGPLRGIGLLHKDLFNLSGRDPGFGHALGQNNPELEDAYVITQLKQAGCGILGTVVMAPYACGATSQNPYFSRSSNPLNENYAVGGSSSGSAIAVASKMSYVSLGSDTAGSIRIPAATCGITGLKTTQGLISLRGVTTLSESLDTVGLLGRFAKDIELILDAVISHSLEPLEAIRHFNYWLPKDVMDPAIASHITSFLAQLEHTNAVDIEEFSSIKEAADIVMAYEINRNYAKIIQSPDSPKGLKAVGKLASQIKQEDYTNCIESKEQLTEAPDGDALGDYEFVRDRMLGVVGEAELRVFETEPPLLADGVDLEHLLLDGLGVILAGAFDARIPDGKLRRRDGFGRDVIGVPDRAERRDGDDDERADGGGDEADLNERIAVAVFDDGGLVFVASAEAELDDSVDE